MKICAKRCSIGLFLKNFYDEIKKGLIFLKTGIIPSYGETLHTTGRSLNEKVDLAASGLRVA